MKITIPQFMWEQLTRKVPPVIEANLEGKTIIVTGANIGLGFEACQHFARMNAGKIVLACRDKARGEAALAKLKEATGYENAHLRILDLASFDSVKAFAQQTNDEEGRLDILVGNAGILPEPTFKPTQDGWEPTIQVNNIASSLLAFLLLPLMVKTAKAHNTTPRLVVVSSEVHYWTTIKKEVIDSPNPLRLFGTDAEYAPKVMPTRYEDSKVINVLFVRALASRLASQPIITNSLNPGYCYSGLRRSFSGIRAMLDWLMEKLIARTAEEGSRQIVWAALATAENDKNLKAKGNEDELRGAYISLSEIMEPSDFVIGEEGKRAQERLWDNLVQELIEIEPKVQGIVDEFLKLN